MCLILEATPNTLETESIHVPFSSNEKCVLFRITHSVSFKRLGVSKCNLAENKNISHNVFTGWFSVST